MNFSAWSIRNPIAPVLAFVLLMVVGWQSFNALPITRFPNIDVPLVAVSVAQSGAAPTEMEAQVTKEIEDAVAGITGVKNITSSISDGVSTTAVEFRMEVPTEKAVQDVKDAIDRIRGSLPGQIEAPIVSRIEVEGQAIMSFAIAAPDKTLEELSWYVDDTIKRALQGKAGVGRIDRYGGADREILIALDPLRLDSFGLSATGVNAQLRQANINLGSGRGALGAREQTIRTLGDAGSVAALEDTMIAAGNGRHVRLGDLGTITDTYEELRSQARFNGEQVVTFSVFRAKGASEVSVARVVEETLDGLRQAHPDVQILPVDDTVFYTYGNYEAALHTLLEGALLSVIVVLLFLRNWRATLITALALPLSAVPTFFIMDLLDFSLNLVSFLAITLATGILVDDAIVEIENIARHIRMGKTPYRAAIEAADEIGLAVIATTFTIVAVFVPVSFMPGIPGQYFRQFGLTVAIAVLFSLMVARLITPMLAAYFMRDKDAMHEEAEDGTVMRLYLGLVRHTLKWRYFTLMGALGVLAVSVFFMVQIPGSFLPPEDVSRIPISVELPPGTALSETNRVTSEIETRLSKINGVEGVFVLSGSSPTGDLDVRRASITVILKRLDHSLLRRSTEILARVPILGYAVPTLAPNGRVRPQASIEKEVFAQIADIPDIRAFKLNDRGQRDISFSILSSNPEALTEAISRLEKALRGDPLLANVSSTGALPRPEVQITPRADQAARLGITTRQISETIRVATIGDVDAALAKVSLDGRQIPVRVRVEGDLKTDINRLGALKIATATGQTVPLSAVADITMGEGAASISRLNRERIATIGANLPEGVVLGTATARFKELAEAVELPPSVRISEAGDSEVQTELFASFINAMILGLLLVLTVLILLFKSVIQPFTILFSLPLAIGGVAAALILTNSAVSMPVLIGILMLMGIVTKNAILLVDFAIEMMSQGMPRIDAMMEAGHKRARPIVMTSIAMSAGMLPSALGVGEGGAFRAPMATAVIGGIIVSTVLSLVVVPSFFLIMDDLSRLISRLFKNMIGEKEAEPIPPTADALGQMLHTAQREIDTLNDRLHRLENAQTKTPPLVLNPKLHVAE